ncbi:MAG: hypothetical protein AB7S41_09030 [Parvibaculaceae bacterium]
MSTTRKKAEAILLGLRLEPVDPLYWAVIKATDRAGILTSNNWRVTPASWAAAIDAISAALEAASTPGGDRP